MTPDDMTLVREFAARQSETAFAALVERHVALVHSAALRQTGDAHLSEEITQAVFIILARKAATLGKDTILPAWLYRTTRYTTGNALKIQRRRREREQEAYMQSTLQTDDTTHAWQQLAPLLDDTMDELSERDRASIVLRYFENRPWREVAALMQMNEDAAQKRVTRALEKLRGLFAKRGVMLTPTLIAVSVSANSVPAAPVGMVKTISMVAVTKGLAATTTTTTLVNGALKIMAWTKIKTAIVIGSVLLLGGSAVVVQQNFFPVEPSYQGRKLSAWLAEIDYSQPQEKRNQASEAIRHMGKKTLPFLMATFESQTSKDEQLGQATWAFDALGPIAKSKIQKLEKLQERYPGYVPSALAGIGPDALPVLLHSLTSTNFWVRDNTAAALGNAIFSEKIPAGMAKAALPIALSNLSYRNPTNDLFEGNTRHRAASLVQALGMEPSESIPALLRCMEESMNEDHYSVAANCALALGHFEADAQPAIPNMIKAMEQLMSHGATNSTLLSCETQFAIALGYCGRGAQAAIPVLTEAANSTNAVLSQFATESLKRIQSKPRK